MTRALRAATLVFGLLAAPLGAHAQPAGKVYLVGLLSIGTIAPRVTMWSAFLDAMRELDYVEGRNLVVRRGAVGRREGARSGQGVRSPPPTDVPPTRARQRQRVRMPTRGRESRVRDRLIGLKNLRGRLQKPGAVVLNFLTDEPQEMAVPSRASKT